MTSKQLIVGVSGSGKTTFIAALRHLLLARKVQTMLSLDRLADSERHLNRLEERWVQCQKMDHTPLNSNAWVVFHLKDRLTGDVTLVEVPDLSGEAFRQIAATGHCKRALYEAMAEVSGVLLFTNADRPTDRLLIYEESQVADALGEHETESSTELGAQEPFAPEKMPEEVQLVEVLQSMNRRPLRPRKRFLAVLVSAWDVVSPNVSPCEWIKKNRPMLWRYATSNPEFWTVRYYGVSAQGGELPGQRDELLRASEPSDRVRVVGPEVAEHDLTTPIAWILTGDIAQ